MQQVMRRLLERSSVCATVPISLSLLHTGHLQMQIAWSAGDSLSAGPARQCFSAWAATSAHSADPRHDVKMGGTMAAGPTLACYQTLIEQPIKPL
jgi:hypothetical protein